MQLKAKQGDLSKSVLKKHLIINRDKLLRSISIKFDKDTLLCTILHFYIHKQHRVDVYELSTQHSSFFVFFLI